MTARALILDFGGVISRTLFETHPMTEAALGLPADSLTWRGPFDPSGDNLWQDMQADRITERQYWQTRTREVARLTGNNWTAMQDFVIAARGADPLPIIRPEALNTIETAHKAGVKLAILSNELDLFYGTEFRKKLPFLKYFDAIVDATYTAILKPDARAYQLCLDTLSLPAVACVFVDDQARNINGADQIGMITQLFDIQNPKQSFADALQHFDL